MKLYCKFHLPAMFQSWDTDPSPTPSIKNLLLYDTKSLKCNTVHTLCIYVFDEHIYLIGSHVSSTD